MVIGFMTESGSKGFRARLRCGPSPVVVVVEEVVVVVVVEVVVVGHLTLEDFHLEHLGHCYSTALASSVEAVTQVFGKARGLSPPASI